MNSLEQFVNSQVKINYQSVCWYKQYKMISKRMREKSDCEKYVWGRKGLSGRIFG